MEEETKAKEELDNLKNVKKMKGLDFNLILLFFVLSLVFSVLYAFYTIISIG